MGLSYQDKLSKAFSKYQDKAQKFTIKMSGKQIHSVLIQYQEDKYGNTKQNVISSCDINVIFDFPNNEIPTSLSSTQDTSSESSTNTLHLYDIIPITCSISNEDIKDFKITKGTILFYPIKMLDDNISVTFFQITDAVTKGNNYRINWSQFTVAPITDFSFRNSPQFKSILNDYIKSLNDY